MEFPDAFTKLWQGRGVKSEKWWSDQYEAAVERISVQGRDEEWVHLLAPTADNSLDERGTIVDIDGSEMYPEDARKQAFELLVLADAAEVKLLQVLASKPKEKP